AAEDGQAGVLQGRELAREGTQRLARYAADGEDLALLAFAGLLGPLALAFALARLDLRDLGHEVTHLADLLLGFLFADGVYGVFHFCARRVHRLEFESRHREPQCSRKEGTKRAGRMFEAHHGLRALQFLLE